MITISIYICKDYLENFLSGVRRRLVPSCQRRAGKQAAQARQPAVRKRRLPGKQAALALPAVSRRGRDGGLWLDCCGDGRDLAPSAGARCRCCICGRVCRCVCCGSAVPDDSRGSRRLLRCRPSAGGSATAGYGWIAVGGWTRPGVAAGARRRCCICCRACRCACCGSAVPNERRGSGRCRAGNLLSGCGACRGSGPGTAGRQPAGA